VAGKISAAAKVTEPEGTGGQRLGCGQDNRASGHGRAKSWLRPRQQSQRARAAKGLAAAKTTKPAGTGG